MAAECQCFGYSYADGNSIRHVGTMAYFSAFNEPVAINGDNRTGSAGHFVLCRRVPVHPETHHRRKGARRERPNWGPTQLMRPARAAPAVPFAICRYANARTFALAIVAAFWPGGTITNPPCLTCTIIFSDWALLLSSLKAAPPVGTYKKVNSEPVVPVHGVAT